MNLLNKIFYTAFLFPTCTLLSLNVYAGASGYFKYDNLKCNEYYEINSIYDECSTAFCKEVCLDGDFLNDCGYSPAEGFIPDEDTAMSIAQIFLLRSGIKQHRLYAYKAILKNNIWNIYGVNMKTNYGEAPLILISKDDGSIFHMSLSNYKALNIETCDDIIKLRTKLPKEGVIPDSNTALFVSIIILSKIYGQENIIGYFPLNVTLSGNIWEIEGTLPLKSAMGGVPIIKLSKIDGRVLYVAHGK